MMTLYRRMWLVVAVLLGTCGGAWSETRPAPLVALVYGEYSFQADPKGEGPNCRIFLDTVRQALSQVGVRATVLNDEAVETDGLLPYRVAIFPYNWAVPPKEVEAISRYLASGGKVIFCYIIPESLAAELGFSPGAHTQGRYERLRLRRELLPGAPESILQNSWNIIPITPDPGKAKVVGEWMGPDGKSLGAGLVLSAKGAYLGHVLTEGDVENKGRMLLALLGKLAPEVPKQVVSEALAVAGGEVQELGAKIAAEPDGAARRGGEAQMKEARARLAQAREVAKTGRALEAITASAEAVRKGERAYCASVPERREEFRGVWLHDAYGVPGWGWERTAKTVREAGFNAIIVNELWAGLANYPSEVLPVSPRVATEGDQIAAALGACQRNGVELHVWKVNYNLANAPREFVEKLRAEGRLQRHRDGTEVEWLCPSDPRNVTLERESMLEVVRNYAITGLHFDYIRYPHSEACYCEGCRARFEQEAGLSVKEWPAEVLSGPLKDQFQQWRRDQVTKLVREVSGEAHRLRPGLKVSAAVFGLYDNDSVGQDWTRWVEEGLLDFVCPMNYTADDEAFKKVVAAEVEVVGHRIPLYIGIGEFMITKTPQLVDQVRWAQKLGAEGFVLFSLESLGPNTERLADLHASLTAHAPSTGLAK